LKNSKPAPHPRAEEVQLRLSDTSQELPLLITLTTASEALVVALVEAIVEEVVIAEAGADILAEVMVDVMVEVLTLVVVAPTDAAMNLNYPSVTSVISKSSRLTLKDPQLPLTTPLPLLITKLLPLTSPAHLTLTTELPLTALERPISALPRQVVEDREDIVVKVVKVVKVVDAVEDMDMVDNIKRSHSVILKKSKLVLHLPLTAMLLMPTKKLLMLTTLPPLTDLRRPTDALSPSVTLASLPKRLKRGRSTSQSISI
jgi:hypothetical protein